MMEQENEKYEKVLEILRRTNPVLSNPDEIEEKILNRIMDKQRRENKLNDLIDLLFGWTYITWVRRSLVTASVFIVIMFVFQQSIMMKQINHLSRQIEAYERDASGVPGGYSDRRMMMLRFSEKRYPFLRKGSSDKQVEELFRTIDRLKKEYKELDKMIEDDPELKKLIEKKLSEIDDKKIKI
jgi:DNA gyrase/topoisomerase IV subunit A